MCRSGRTGGTPYDVHLRGHVIALLWGITPFLITRILPVVALLRSDDGHWGHSLFSLLLAILPAAYAMRTLEFGLPPQTRESEPALLQSIALQKVRGIVLCRMAHAAERAHSTERAARGC